MIIVAVAAVARPHGARAGRRYRSDPVKNVKASDYWHSIDLHAVNGPGGGAGFTQVEPGREKAFEWKALNPGPYVYHCATPHIPAHVANAMDTGALKGKVGETVRLFVGNGGPNLISSFHVIEFTLNVPGRFLIVDHSISRAMDKGALGSIVVEGPKAPHLFRSLDPGAEPGSDGH